MTTNDHAPDARPTRDGLAGRLRALRAATDLSQTAAAKAIGASQNKVSRIESGQFVPGPAEVTALCRLYGADPATRRELVAWAKDLAAGEVDARVMLRRDGGTAAFQARIRRMEEEARLVRSFQPGMVIGVLQTERYADVVFNGDKAAVAERMRRHEQLLADSSRRWVLVQPVGALLWNLGGREVMAEQMDALVRTSLLPQVDLRVITPDQASTFAVTHGFHLYSGEKSRRGGSWDRCVVGILTGTTIDENKATIQRYVDLHAALVDLSVGGDEARATVEQIAADYRR